MVRGGRIIYLLDWCVIVVCLSLWLLPELVFVSCRIVVSVSFESELFRLSYLVDGRVMHLIFFLGKARDEGIK